MTAGATLYRMLTETVGVDFVTLFKSSNKMNALTSS